MDMMFEQKYDHFKYLFENCCKDFQREMINLAQYRYYARQEFE